MNTPERIAESLKAFLQGRDDVLAAWEGGSAATGFQDAFSDLDLAVVCRDDGVEAVIAGMDRFLSESYGVVRRFRVPEPAWHRFSQVFYMLRDTPEYYYLDAAFIRASLPDKFTGEDRHGKALVWFEKEPVVDRSPTAPEEVLARSCRLYRAVTGQDFLLITEVKKALARGLYTEAFPFYFQFVSRNLGTLLNLKHRPARGDFGVRYGYRDYPSEDAELLEALFSVNSLETLRSRFDRALARYGELVVELGALGKEEPSLTSR